MLANERLEDVQNFFLLAAWQLRCGLEQPPHFADRPRTASLAFTIGQQHLAHCEFAVRGNGLARSMRLDHSLVIPDHSADAHQKALAASVITVIILGV